MFVPDPVVSMSITLQDKSQAESFSKGLARFTREDPTFQLSQDRDSGESLVSGMGELHLEIYAQRLSREYNAQCVLGKPRVAFRETLSKPFEYVCVCVTSLPRFRVVFQSHVTRLFSFPSGSIICTRSNRAERVNTVGSLVSWSHCRRTATRNCCSPMRLWAPTCRNTLFLRWRPVSVDPVKPGHWRVSASREFDFACRTGTTMR